MNRRNLISCALAVGTHCAAIAWGQSPMQPGADFFASQPGTMLDFVEGFPPIPGDFFGPGSEPFHGWVHLTGNPSPSSPTNHDTVIQRLTPASLVNEGALSIVPIDMVALSLRSVEPIQVTFSGGGVDSFFDVFVTLQPMPPLGVAGAIRTDLMSGTISYSPRITLVVTFVPLGPGNEATLEIPDLQMQQDTPADWGQVPFAGVANNPTPNMFPRTSFRLSSPDGGFVHELAPARHFDCDGDGASDSDQIADNPNLDLNRNGVLDGCETNAGLTQISFPDLEGGFADRFTASGQLAIRYIPSFFDVFWAHSSLGAGLSTLNAPMLDVNTQVEFHTTHIPVALPQMLPNTQLPSLPVSLRFTPDPTGPLVLFNAPVFVPVFEHILSPGVDDGPFTVPFTHGLAEGIITPAVPVGTWMTVSRRSMEGVNEAANHCAPGAVARSLDWLENLLCLNLPETNDEAQEMYAKLRNMQHLMTSSVNGTSRSKYVPGITQFLMDKMLEDCLTVMQVTDNDPCKMFEDLQRGCDVVGNISWYKADGTRDGGHAVTVSAAIKCDEEVSIEFNDDAHGKDSQGDGKADRGDTKKAKIMDDAANPGRKRMVGYGRNSWDGYIKICPTRKCQIDAINKWVNGDPASGVEGLESLVNRLLGGAVPTEADKQNIKRWAENAYDAACFLVKNLEGCDDPALDEAKMAAADIKSAMGIVVVRCIIYSIDCNLAELAILPTLLGSAFDALRDQIRSGVDCDMNGVDDLIDIARGDATDANGNCIPDSCETQPCPGDFDMNGTVDLLDLLAFVSAWSTSLGQSVPPGTGGDFSNDGLVDLIDLLGFVSGWSMNLGQPCP